MILQSLKLDRENCVLEVLNQLELPSKIIYYPVRNTEDGYHVIQRMIVRGAPAIAIVGAISVALDVREYAEKAETKEDLVNFVLEKFQKIVKSRPTAVNLSKAADDLSKLVLKANCESPVKMAELLLQAATDMLAEDLSINERIGSHGSEWIKNCVAAKTSVVTICNTGSLATAGYGTALGIIRSLSEKNFLESVYALETRPYNQGARLTAFELVHDNLPGTLITDSMAAFLFSQNKNVKVAIVGADRVARNGDTANKIGTYQLAVLARYHGVKFIVAAPTNSIDLTIPDGTHIPIEERPPHELTTINGVPIAAEGINVWNPAFDVTPAALIDAIVTENGVYTNKGAFDLAKDPDS